MFSKRGPRPLQLLYSKIMLNYTFTTFWATLHVHINTIEHTFMYNCYESMQKLLLKHM